MLLFANRSLSSEEIVLMAMLDIAVDAIECKQNQLTLALSAP